MRFPSFQDTAVFLLDLPGRAGDRVLAILAWIGAHPQLFTLVFLLAIGPAIFWLWLFLRKGAMDGVHRRFMVWTFLAGTLSVPLVFAIHLASERLFHLRLNILFRELSHPSLAMLLHFVVIVGMLEEYAKHVIVKEVDYRKRFFGRVVDGIEFSIAAALGFAFIENILYFIEAWNSLPAGKFAGVVLVRSLGSMLAHVLFSGIFGYYYGRAKFIDDTPRMSRAHHFHLHLLDGIRVRYARVKHALAGSHLLREAAHVLRRDELIAEGLVISMVLHGLYDFFLGVGKVYLVVPFLFLEYLFIWHELEVAGNFTVHELKERSRFRMLRRLGLHPEPPAPHRPVLPTRRNDPEKKPLAKSRR